MDGRPMDSRFSSQFGHTGSGKAEIGVAPLSAKPHAESAARILASDPAYSLFQPQLSPDGHWIVFEAIQDRPSGRESTLHVVPAAGGRWDRLTDGKQWEDKPDGKAYFVSLKGGLYNVWARHLDPRAGKVDGPPFRITAFQTDGIWALDNIDKN